MSDLTLDGLRYANAEQIFEVENRNGLPCLSYPLIESTGIVRHLFTTRLGGVSEGMCSTLNLSYERGDDPEAVLENYRRVAAARGVELSDMVCTQQTHTTNIRVATRKDGGKGVTRKLDYCDIDGLITNERGLCLCAFYADCVPLYFVDPVHKAIGLSHSGWKGTVQRMGQVTLDRMKEAFGTSPEDVYAAIGPSICQDCYEVSDDVIDRIKEAFDPVWHDTLFRPNDRKRYQLNLWKACEITLLEAGVRKEHLAVTNLCTSCNKEYLFSHRATRGRRGNLGAFLCLK